MQRLPVLPAFFVALFGLLLGVSIAAAQAKDAPKDASAKDGKKDASAKDTSKDAPSKDGAKDGKKAEEWLDDKAMQDLMEEMLEEWDNLRAAQRSKVGKDAAAAADKLAKLSPKMLKYHKKEVREAKDWKEWTADLEKYAKEYSAAAKKSSWDDATKARQKMNTACSSCHKAYRTDEEDD